MAERPFQPVPNTPLVADPTGDAIWKRWLQGLQSFLGNAVRGPGSSTDNAVARWDGATGTFLNNSGVIIDDSNNVSGIVNLTTTGSTILGDSAADTYSITAGTWTIGADYISTRAVGTAAAGLKSFTEHATTFTGDAGGTTLGIASFSYLQILGSANVDTARQSQFRVTHSGSGTVTEATAFYGDISLASTGNITAAQMYNASGLFSSSGSITGALTAYRAGALSITSSGTVANYVGFNCANIGHANITTAIAFNAADITGSTTMIGFQSAISAGAGKKNINVTGTADNSLAGPLYLAQDGKTQQTASAIYAGTGVPNNANGNNNDFYFRGNGTVAGSNIVYHKEAGAWVALTGGGGGGDVITAATVNVASPVLEAAITVIDASVTAADRIVVTWGNCVATDENGPSMGQVYFNAIPAAGSFTVELFSVDNSFLFGDYKINYSRAT